MGVEGYFSSPGPSLLQLGFFLPQTSRWKTLLSFPGLPKFPYTTDLYFQWEEKSF